MNVNKIIYKFVSISFSVLVALLVIIGLVRLGTFCYDFGYRVFTEEPVADAPGTDVNVRITEDMSEMDIGKLLEEKGLVRNGKLFYAQLKLSAYSGDLLPGEYTLNTSMEAKDMMAVMATKAVVDTETEAETETTDDESGTDTETEVTE